MQQDKRTMKITIRGQPTGNCRRRGPAGSGRSRSRSFLPIPPPPIILHGVAGAEQLRSVLSEWRRDRHE